MGGTDSRILFYRKGYVSRAVFWFGSWFFVNSTMSAEKGMKLSDCNLYVEKILEPLFINLYKWHNFKHDWFVLQNAVVGRFEIFIGCI